MTSNPPVTPGDEELLRQMFGPVLFKFGMAIREICGKKNGEKLIDLLDPLEQELFSTAMPILQAHITTKCLEEREEAEFIHLSDLARAVGLLEGLGYPDDILNKRYEKMLAALRAQKEEKLA